MSQGRREICGADAKKLLPRVEGISMLRSEGASSRDAFNVSEKQASGGQRNNPLYIT